MKKKTTTCVAVVQSYINKIEQDKHLNAFIEVFDKESLMKAEQIDKKIKKGSEIVDSFVSIKLDKIQFSYKYT